MVPSYIQDSISPLVSEVSYNPLRNTKNITVPLLYLIIEQLFHNNLVFHHPLDYGILLQMFWKIHPHYQLLKNISLHILT